MRRTMLATASVVLLACLGACTDDASDDASDGAVVVQPNASPDPTSLDPFAWNDVSYEDYLAAADELGLRPDVLLPMAGFSSGLNALCHSTAEELAAMRAAQMDHTKDTETYSTARYLGDEVALRLGLACPQRMTDWNAANRDHHGENSDADDGVSAVTDAELAEAIAEEAEASNDPDDDHGGYDSAETASDEDSESDHASDHESASSEESDGEVSTTSTGGVTSGNGSRID